MRFYLILAVRELVKVPPDLVLGEVFKGAFFIDTVLRFFQDSLINVGGIDDRVKVLVEDVS